MFIKTSKSDAWLRRSNKEFQERRNYTLHQRGQQCPGCGAPTVWGWCTVCNPHEVLPTPATLIKVDHLPPTYFNGRLHHPYKPKKRRKGIFPAMGCACCRGTTRWVGYESPYAVDGEEQMTPEERRRSRQRMWKRAHQKLSTRVKMTPEQRREKDRERKRREYEARKLSATKHVSTSEETK